jgi:hypothetical protein
MEPIRRCRSLVEGLTGPANQISDETLSNNGLMGETGRLKRNWLQRLKDKFFMYWNSLPRTNGKTEKA